VVPIPTFPPPIRSKLFALLEACICQKALDVVFAIAKVESAAEAPTNTSLEVGLLVPIPTLPDGLTSIKDAPVLPFLKLRVVTEFTLDLPILKSLPGAELKYIPAKVVFVVVAEEFLIFIKPPLFAGGVPST